jgi:hypothetical protein
MGFSFQCIIIHTGKGGGEAGKVEPERKGGGQQGRVKITSWFESTNMNECTQEIGYLQSITLINTGHKVPLQVNFLDVDILHWLLLILSFYDYMVNRNARTDFNKNNNGGFSIQLFVVFGLDRRVD